jgi:hypothetical protein
MAFPFQAMPTLAEFVGWAKAQGCLDGPEVELVGPRGPTTVRSLIGPNGAFALIPGVPGDERLTPTVVGSLCRQLGIGSLFPGF